MCQVTYKNFYSDLTIAGSLFYLGLVIGYNNIDNANDNGSIVNLYIN